MTTTEAAWARSGRRRAQRPLGESWRSVVLWVLVPAVITLVAWQRLALQPGLGIDLSWQAGLEIATHNGIAFGTHLIFPYGPLGFLSVQGLWYHDLAELAFAYTALVRFGLALALFVAARRSYGSVAAFLVAVVVASVDTQLTEMVVLLVAAVVAVSDRWGGRTVSGLVGLAGAFAAFELLNKVSIGISLAAMTVVLVLALHGPRVRLALTAVLAFIATLVVAWLAAGQPLSALPHYLANSEQIVSGYGAAMGIGNAALGWTYPAALLGLAIGLFAAWDVTGGMTMRQRLGIVGLWLVFWFFAFKEGFVRQDAIHTGWFFGALVGGFVALRWRRERRAVGLGATAALVTCALAAQSASLGDVVSPSRNIRAALHDLRTVASSSRSKQIAAAGRAQIIAAASIDPRSMTELRGHTVAIYPLEIAVTWAYGLRWDPIPVEQSYSAYTTHLDDLDARFLRSANAPQRFLIGPPEADIEGRITSFDAPATSRAIVCNYAPLSTGTRYAVLAHRPNRCAVPRLMATVHAGWGQSVHVPGPPDAHSTVIARISGAGSGPVESLRALLWKPAPRFVSINGAAPVPFVTGTAEDGLPLRAAPGIDLPVPFNVFPQATTIAIFNAGAPLADGAPVTYRFYSQSVS